MNKTLNKTIAYSSFAIAAMLVLYAFLTAKSYTQLAIASVLYPAIVYYALQLFPRGHSHKKEVFTNPVPEKVPAPIKKGVSVETVGERVEVVDLDKRTFLKLVGSVGLSFFVFSVLGQRVGNLIFGAAPNTSGGNSNTPPGNQVGSSGILPTSGYTVTEIAEGDISYYGFTNMSQGWIIMRQDSETSSFRYAKGSSGFPASWSNRDSLKYDYFYNLN